MRIDFDLLSATIGDIYEGVGTSNPFRGALERIRKVFGASRVALVARLADDECIYYGDRPESEGVCSAHRSVTIRDGSSRSPISVHTGKICSNCITPRPANRLCCCAAVSAGPSVLLSMHRDAGSPPFTESERRALEWLGPHLLQAVRLSNRIEIAETARAMGSQVLEEVRRGVVILNSRKEVVFMNHRAEAICASARGAAVARQPSGKRTLKATSAAEDAVLQGAIDAALRHDSAARHNPPSDAVRIGGSHLGRPLLIRVAQLPPQPASSGQRHAVLFIDDLAVKELGDERLLTALYGLTRAEVRIAAALLAGERPKAIAARFAVSEDTVRTQLRAVYAKTETRGLASLLALLSRLADVPVLEVCEAVDDLRPPTRSRVSRVRTTVLDVA